MVAHVLQQRAVTQAVLVRLLSEMRMETQLLQIQTIRITTVEEFPKTMHAQELRLPAYIHRK
ncbi:MAG TPA: hypothetical protein VGT05_02940 [Patescibacteria group bacterium]|nr:hypothetical protein [Patescibacteria group bacterium]